MAQRKNIGVIVAGLTGMMFGGITTIEGYVGRQVGAVNASLIEHACAALVAVPAVVFLFMRGNLTWEGTKSIMPISAIAGVIIIVAVAGVAYAMPRVGVAAGNMAMLFGQMAVAVVIDLIGVGGYEKVPRIMPRILGLVLVMDGQSSGLPRQS